MPDDPKLAEVLRRLRQAYEPERIYLFGSMARGEAGPDSEGAGAGSLTKCCGGPERRLTSWSGHAASSMGG
jgi:hypothetical protein